MLKAVYATPATAFQEIGSHPYSPCSESIFSKNRPFSPTFHPVKSVVMKTKNMVWALAMGSWLPGLMFLQRMPDLPASGAGEAAAGILADSIFRCDNGKVSFKSDAPLEVIKAKSAKLRGAIDPANQSFAWTVEIKTFEGFNNPLQREHFNENYMESKRYPKASFVGKIIEKIDFQVA